jgi:hypothetical protein
MESFDATAPNMAEKSQEILQENRHQFVAVREMTYSYRAWMLEGERRRRSRFQC